MAVIRTQHKNSEQISCLLCSQLVRRSWFETAAFCFIIKFPGLLFIMWCSNNNQRHPGEDDGDDNHSRPPPQPMDNDEQNDEESTATSSDDFSYSLNHLIGGVLCQTFTTRSGPVNDDTNHRRGPGNPEAQRQLLVSILENAMRICIDDADFPLPNQVRRSNNNPRRTSSSSPTDDNSKRQDPQ